MNNNNKKKTFHFLPNNRLVEKKKRVYDVIDEYMYIFFLLVAKQKRVIQFKKVNKITNCIIDFKFNAMTMNCVSTAFLCIRLMHSKVSKLLSFLSS